MFQIDYGILREDKEWLISIKDIKEFELEFGMIVGQIQLILNERVEGFVDCEIPYNGEFLDTWFSLLNQVVIKLKTDKFVAIEIIGSADIWIEFEVIEKMILISEIRAKAEKYVPTAITSIPKDRSEFFWSESIQISEFVSGVLAATDRFIQDVIEINDILRESRTVTKLNGIFQTAKRVWNYV